MEWTNVAADFESMDETARRRIVTVFGCRITSDTLSYRKGYAVPADLMYEIRERIDYFPRGVG